MATYNNNNGIFHQSHNNNNNGSRTPSPYNNHGYSMTQSPARGQSTFSSSDSATVSLYDPTLAAERINYTIQFNNALVPSVNVSMNVAADISDETTVSDTSPPRPAADISDETTVSDTSPPRPAHRAPSSSASYVDSSSPVPQTLRREDSSSSSARGTLVRRADFSSSSTTPPYGTFLRRPTGGYRTLVRRADSSSSSTTPPYHSFLRRPNSGYIPPNDSDSPYIPSSSNSAISDDSDSPYFPPNDPRYRRRRIRRRRTPTGLTARDYITRRRRLPATINYGAPMRDQRSFSLGTRFDQ